MLTVSRICRVTSDGTKQHRRLLNQMHINHHTNAPASFKNWDLWNLHVSFTSGVHMICIGDTMKRTIELHVQHSHVRDKQLDLETGATLHALPRNRSTRDQNSSSRYLVLYNITTHCTNVGSCNVFSRSLKTYRIIATPPRPHINFAQVLDDRHGDFDSSRSQHVLG